MTLRTFLTQVTVERGLNRRIYFVTGATSPNGAIEFVMKEKCLSPQAQYSAVFLGRMIGSAPMAIVATGYDD